MTQLVTRSPIELFWTAKNDPFLKTIEILRLNRALGNMCETRVGCASGFFLTDICKKSKSPI